MERLKRKSRAAQLRPGPNIVRAWFDTVINPILAGLETEQRFLEKQNWTWQFRPEGLESIRPMAVWIRLGVRVDAWSNVEQFLAFHDDINSQIERHDATVHQLTTLCRKCHKVLTKSPELIAAYRVALSPESAAQLVAKYPIRSQGSIQIELSGKSLAEEYFGGYPQTDHLALLAQYVLNRTPELPDYFATAPLWNEYRQRFLTVLDAARVRSAYADVVRSGKKLMEINRTLIRRLKESRLKLSLEHDVPYVAAQENLGARVEWPLQ